MTAPGSAARPDPLGPEAVEDLARWVAMATVSSDPERAAEVRRSAHWLTAAMRRLGVPRAEVWETQGLPAVYGCWPAADPAAPVLLVYSHHDVHAADPREWRVTPPFQPVRRGGRLYGRGASDAKGQVMCHLWALRAHLAAGAGSGRAAPAVTVKYLIEGEEEIGSVHLADLLAEHPGELGADVVMVSDTMLWALDRPAVCTTVRGSVTATLTVRGADRGIHSGAVSGAASNAATELARVLGGLHDDSGRITLPGFYDAVADPAPALRESLADFPFDTAAWLEQTGTFAAQGEAGFTVPERLWTRPAAEVARLTAGRTDMPSLGLVPPEAGADLLLRLVPDQRADRVAEQLRAWLDARRRPGYRYLLDVSPTISDPYRTPSDHPALAALTRAVGHAYGAPARPIGNGGAAPAAQLARACDAPVLFFGTGLPGDRWHGPDEGVDLAALRLGIRALTRFLGELARSSGNSPAPPGP
ncbi:M20/M25/M40 family metallo-hydrolase [Streptomyces sp. NPDC046866]|uniref:M20/M25/M40 family metallo-hydrolase n=1 Tax=Streptomyces sp. NPDC046866 TaxID=3154921 RepID=UPI003454A42A